MMAGCCCYHFFTTLSESLGSFWLQVTTTTSQRGLQKEREGSTDTTRTLRTNIGRRLGLFETYFHSNATKETRSRHSILGTSTTTTSSATSNMTKCFHLMMVIICLITICFDHATARSYQPRQIPNNNNNEYPMRQSVGDDYEYPLDPGQPFPGTKFGPMGPIDRDDFRMSKEIRNLASDTGTTAPIATSSPSPKEYAIFSVEFHRVETPFVIGLWIFFASLAKIGEWVREFRSGVIGRAMGDLLVNIIQVRRARV